MSLATSVSRVTGYLRVAILAYALGIQRLADSYNLANTMPNMIYELLMGGILSSLFVPVFVEHLVKGDREEASYVASAVANLTLLILLVFAGAGIIFSFPLVRTQTLLVPGGEASVKLASFFFKFFAPQIIFYGLGAIFTGVLHSHKRFAAPAFAPILNNLVVITTVLFFFLPNYQSNPDLALIALAVGTTLGVASMSLIQVPSLLRVGVRYHPVLDLRHPSVQKLGRLAVPVLGYVVANQIGLTVSNNLAYQFRGGITAYQYSWYLFQLPYGIFAVSITTALFPGLSEHAAKKDFRGFRESLSLGIRSIGFIVIPAAIALMVLSSPLVRLLYQHGRFDLQATRYTAPILTFFALGLFSFSTYMFLTRAFYSLQDTKTPLKTNALGVPLNIAANLLLIGFLGVRGLALGHALTYTFTAGLLFYLLRRRIGNLDGRRIIFAVARFLAASLVMAVPSFYLFFWLESRMDVSTVGGQILQLLITGVVGLSLYLVANYFMGSPELKSLWRIARRSPLSGERGGTMTGYLAKIVLVVLVLGILVNDLGSVFLVRYEIGAIAREAAGEAYAEKVRTNSYSFALRAAQQAAALRNASVVSLQLLPDGVEVTVRKPAHTLVLHRSRIFERFIQAEAVSTAPET
jgi:putative peptidoglycan lipid II flippase